ncbi:MAG: TlpA family protein disulfide reductase [Chloroflexota bacterium]
MKRALWTAVIAIPLIVLLATGFSHDPDVIASPLVGKPAPAFSLRDLSGRRVSLSSLRGRPVLVNFWASWCLSCKVEHPSLLAAWRKFGKHVAFVGIDYQDQASDARAYLRQHGGDWPILQDPGSVTAVNYGVSGVPESFLIDARGVVRYKFQGPIVPGTTMTPQQLQRDLRALGRA